MTWEALGAIGEVLGAIAVFLTLVYLASQIRQNTRSMDESRRLAITQSQQDWTAMFNDQMIAMSESEHLGAIQPGTFDVSALTDEEVTRLRFRLSAMAARLDMMHLQYQNGFLPQETYETTFTNSVKTFGPLMVEVNASLEMRRPSFVSELRRIISSDT